MVMMQSRSVLFVLSKVVLESSRSFQLALQPQPFSLVIHVHMSRVAATGQQTAYPCSG